MNLHVTMNNKPKDFICQPIDTLLDLLWRESAIHTRALASGDPGKEITLLVERMMLLLCPSLRTKQRRAHEEIFDIGSCGGCRDERGGGVRG
jgi:hypothetical protein